MRYLFNRCCNCCRFICRKTCMMCKFLYSMWLFFPCMTRRIHRGRQNRELIVLEYEFPCLLLNWTCFTKGFASISEEFLFRLNYRQWLDTDTSNKWLNLTRVTDKIDMNAAPKEALLKINKSIRYHATHSLLPYHPSSSSFFSYNTNYNYKDLRTMYDKWNCMWVVLIK